MNALAWCLLWMAEPAPVAPSVAIDFQRQIRPILSDACFHCHGPDEKKREGDLRLDRKQDVLSSERKPRIVTPGKPGESELIARILSEDPDQQMPPPDSGRKLSDQQRDILKKWIESGAEYREHWAFVPPVRPPIPSTARLNDPHPINALVDERLHAEGLSLADRAPEATLARRLTLSLIGLPPTPSEVSAFEKDNHADRIDRLVDRLLSSPAYGEHWAAPWLDAARYADTNGYQEDRTRVMWPWRDWVVQSLNANMPFDQFTIEQMAGDLLPDPTHAQRLATGFHRNHMLNGEGGRIPEESRVEYVVDRVDTTATIWLGLTLACSRCHDHKYDPLPQTDYYRMFGYFNSIEEVGGVDRGGNAAPVMKLPTPEQEERQRALRDEIAQLEKQQSGPDATKRIDECKKEIEAIDKSMVETMVLAERKEPRDTYLLVRGAYDNPDPSKKLTPGTPVAIDTNASGKTTRMDLARWLVARENPLTARVTVNRFWQNFFGTGLVKTTEDFGSQGELPVQPALLDWLAVEFIESGWDVKALHRIIATSGVFTQTSRVTPTLLERDPDNRLLARGPRRRLAAFVLRDQALALSGLEVRALGGPGVNPYQPANIWTDFSLGKIQYKQDSGPALYRRSLYTFWRRSVGPTMFFDVPNRQVCSVRPQLTNTPLQALTLLNDPIYIESARGLADRALTEGGQTPEDRLRWAFQLATARPPTNEEVAVLSNALRRSLDDFAADEKRSEVYLSVGESKPKGKRNHPELAAYAAVMNLILNLDEVVSLE